MNPLARRGLVAALLVLPLVAHADCATDLPASMKAARIHAYGAGALQLETVPVPKPAANEVLVEVRATSINPIDWKMRDGLVANWWPLELPETLGRDLAGVVVGVGPGVNDWACGNEVVALLGESKDGAHAEYIAVNVADLAPKPKKLSFEEAGAYPLVAMTAWRALVDQGGLQAGDRVLIHGGAGGVGTMAVQIAKARGAHVITTASARNHDFLRSLGADEVIDYRTQKFEEIAKDVTLVLDAVGGDLLARSAPIVVDGGRLVTIAARLPAVCKEGRVTCPPERPADQKAAFAEIAKLVDAGRLRINVERTYPLDEVVAAYEQNKAGHVRGKLVVVP